MCYNLPRRTSNIVYCNASISLSLENTHLSILAAGDPSVWSQCFICVNASVGA